MFQFVSLSSVPWQQGRAEWDLFFFSVLFENTLTIVYLISCTSDKILNNLYPRYSLIFKSLYYLVKCFYWIVLKFISGFHTVFHFCDTLVIILQNLNSVKQTWIECFNMCPRSNGRVILNHSCQPVNNKNKNDNLLS